MFDENAISIYFSVHSPPIYGAMKTIIYSLKVEINDVGKLKHCDSTKFAILFTEVSVTNLVV